MSGKQATIEKRKLSVDRAANIVVGALSRRYGISPENFNVDQASYEEENERNIYINVGASGRSEWYQLVRVVEMPNKGDPFVQVFVRFDEFRRAGLVKANYDTTFSRWLLRKELRTNISWQEVLRTKSELNAFSKELVDGLFKEGNWFRVGITYYPMG